jgi:hypothetical protein
MRTLCTPLQRRITISYCRNSRKRNLWHTKDCSAPTINHFSLTQLTRVFPVSSNQQQTHRMVSQSLADVSCLHFDCICFQHAPLSHRCPAQHCGRFARLSNGKGECRREVTRLRHVPVLHTRRLVILTTEHRITHANNGEWNQVQAPIRSSVVNT